MNQCVTGNRRTLQQKTQNDTKQQPHGLTRFHPWPENAREKINKKRQAAAAACLSGIAT
jgi:hypothetical protein